MMQLKLPQTYHQDSASRKFFALAGATKTIQDAVKNAQTDEYFFGKDCLDRKKAAQTIQKTSAQIKTAEKGTEKKTTKTTINKKQLNWRGPPQYQQYQRARGGQHHIQQQQFRKQTRFDHPPQRTQRQPVARSKYRR